MPVSYLFQGILIGLLIAMPVGPIGLVCLRNSLTFGMRRGLISGVGAAAADTLFGMIAAFSLSALGSLLMDHQTEIQLIGALVLCYLGFCTFFTDPSKKEDHQGQNGAFKTFITTFFLTLTNPMTILAFIAIYAALGLGETPLEIIHGLLLVIGVFFGSCMWWLFLSSISSVIRKKMNERAFLVFNRISGFFIFSCGVIALITA